MVPCVSIKIKISSHLNLFTKNSESYNIIVFILTHTPFNNPFIYFDFPSFKINSLSLIENKSDVRSKTECTVVLYVRKIKFYIGYIHSV